MGGCGSKLTDESAAERYKAQWQQPGLGEGLGAGGFGLGASAPAAPAYTTTANVGLGRGEERVFLRDPALGGLQLPRIEEDQALQGQESPTKSQLSSAPSQVPGPGGDKPGRPPNWTKGELIGQGAFGSVYLGMDNDSGQLMAVKQVHVSKAAERGKVSEHLKGLEAEVLLLQQLDHANIVRYLGTELTDETLNIFLEYVPGGSIASLLAKFGSFRESVIKVYTKQILLGLEYLHKNSIMHRDIKGANILVDNTGLVKLADFGASKKIEDLVTIESGFKSVKGTPYWMAPEVITQTGHGRQADIWSVACTVIEMATGKPPWSQFGSQVSAMFHIASSKGPPTIPENLSADCKDFLYLCFNRSWKDRPSALRLLQHPFLADVVCRTVAAPLNNIANVAQEPSIKAWRVPKSVRVPSPMREESEGMPFSTPSPMHPRMAERAGGTGAARISTATSQGVGDGDQTPGAGAAAGDLPLSPLGQHMVGSRRDFAPSAAPAPLGASGRQLLRSPNKPRPSVRSSAPVLRGYASVALAAAPQLERPAEPRAAVGNSAASSVHPRPTLLAESQQPQQQGTISREGSMAADATLRASGSSSLRGSRDQVQLAAGPLPAAERPGLLLIENEAYQPLRPREAPLLETPAAARRAGLGSSSEFQGGCAAGSGVGQEASTPSTGDSRGTFKSDYNPMEEPSWMQHMEPSLDGSPSPARDGSPASQQASRLSPQPEPSTGHDPPRKPSAGGPPAAQPPQPSSQQATAAQQQEQHMVWMDDDGSINALPWDMGSWSVGSGEPSPSGSGVTGAPEALGEPVGQDVLITALNRRAHMEVRASLALFESTLKSLNVPKLLREGTPSPGASKPGTQLAAAPGAGPRASLGASTGAPLAKLAPAFPSKEDLTALAQPVPLGAAATFPTAAPGMPEDSAPAFGGREAVWEQELSRELSQFGQLPSQWRYAAGSRRMSMHGSPQKVPPQQQ